MVLSDFEILLAIVFFPPLNLMVDSFNIRVCLTKISLVPSLCLFKDGEFVLELRHVLSYTCRIHAIGYRACPKVIQVTNRRIMQVSRKIIATSAKVTLNGGLVRESTQNILYSSLGIMAICPVNMFSDATIESGE